MRASCICRRNTYNFVKTFLEEEMENGESEWGIDSLPSPPFQSSLSLDLSAAAACTFYPPPFLLSAMQSVCLSTVEFLHPLRFGAPSVGSDGREGGSRAAPMRVDGARFRIGRREREDRFQRCDDDRRRDKNALSRIKGRQNTRTICCAGRYSILQAPTPQISRDLQGA